MPTVESRGRMALSPAERVLRTINILTFIPGIAFLVATGVARECLWAFIGIAPLSLSALLGVFTILARSRPHVFITLMDLVVGSFTLAIDIWSWTEGRQSGLVSRPCPGMQVRGRGLTLRRLADKPLPRCW